MKDFIFNPNKNFTSDDVKNFRQNVEESIKEGEEEQIAKYIEEIDSILIKEVNKSVKDTIFSPSARIKIDLKYFDSLKNIYENRGFKVREDKLETGRTYENMGDFYDTEFIQYDYYIVVGLR